MRRLQQHYPSVKAIMTKLGLSKEQAQKLREKMWKGHGLAYYNRISNSLGIESVCLPDGCLQRLETPKIDMYYVNRGDSYKTTLLKVNGIYSIGAWASVVERFPVRQRRS